MKKFVRYMSCVTPFSCDIPHCVDLEGAKVTQSILNIKGWVETELGVPG